jgi:hypothetical protein
MGRDGRMGQGVDQKKIIFNRELLCFESEIREWAEMGEWAKASIEKKNFKFKSGRVGSGRVSNLELVDNKRAPNSRVGKVIRIISFIFFICYCIRQETLKKLHYFFFFFILHRNQQFSTESCDVVSNPK